MADRITFEISDADEEWFQKQVATSMPKSKEMLVTQVGQQLQMLNGILSQVEYVPDFVRAFVDDLGTLNEMLGDRTWDLSDQSEPWILYALGYLVNTVDAVPDSVPLVGFLDDVVVVRWICRKLKGDMHAFRNR